MMCRREHITHYENLANLDKIVNTRFTFIGFPLKLRVPTAAPHAQWRWWNKGHTAAGPAGVRDTAGR